MNEIILVQPIVGSLDMVKNSPAIPLSIITAVSNLKSYEIVIVDQRTTSNWKEILRR